MSQIYSASVAPTQHRARRILVLAAALAIAGTLAAAAYAGYTLTRSATLVATIGCYESASLDANTAVLASDTDSPVAACASTYASAFPSAQRHKNFAACVLPTGSVGVFPSDSTSDTCKSLGLANLAHTPAASR